MTGIYDNVDLQRLRELLDEAAAAAGPQLRELKLTQAELEELTRSIPVVRPRPGSYAAAFGIPITIVERWQDSTIFKLRWESVLRRLGGKP